MHSRAARVLRQLALQRVPALACAITVGGSAALTHSWAAPAAAATAASAPADWRPAGVVAVSVAQYQANEQLEDRYGFAGASAAAGVGGDDGSVFVASVFDGHGGWQAAEYAASVLPAHVLRELRHATSVDDPSQVALAASRAFARTDRGFLDGIRPAYALGFGEVARVGACALTAIVTPRFVVVANAGDCRAVLGRLVDGDDAGPATTGGSSHDAETAAVVPVSLPGSTGRRAVALTLPLSSDHNARMPQEAAKLRAAHPGEPDIVVCRSPTACYVKGRLQPTRALGDGYLKHSEFNAPAGAARAWGRHIPPPYTPPYISAQPETRIEWLRRPGTGGTAAEATSRVGGGRDGATDSATSPLDGSLAALRDATTAKSASSATASWWQRLLAMIGIGARHAAPDAVRGPPTANAAPGAVDKRDFLVLACDGVWDVLSSEDAVRFVAEDEGDPRTVAQRMMEHVLEREANNADISLAQLKALPPGRQRRSVHDDITVIVMYLGSPSPATATATSKVANDIQVWPRPTNPTRLPLQ